MRLIDAVNVIGREIRMEARVCIYVLKHEEEEEGEEEDQSFLALRIELIKLKLERNIIKIHIDSVVTSLIETESPNLNFYIKK